jgi:hypothetical protein
MSEKELSVLEIDKILNDLEKSLDVGAGNEEIKIMDVHDAKDSAPNTDTSLLRFECPSAIWEEFADYCVRNELDPAQQIKEAIISYYRNLWQTYRIRKRLHNDSSLV